MSAHTVICGHCGIETADDVGGTCPGCGAPLTMLEPLVVQCGWCGTDNPRDELTHCRSCGGLLPSLPGGDPGPRPPAVPRELPAGYALRVRWTGNVDVMIGLVFTVLFFWTVIFGVVGVMLFQRGWKRADGWLAALRSGRATGGVLAEVIVDTSQHVNNVHPWKLTYTYERADGTIGEGFVTVWDPSSARRHAGDAIWVVYEGEASSIWPPLK